ncbi:GAF domain-containing protein [Collimonas sp. PA-H2]|uniref:GAF domain-containing protein n=1 Tax=Collimonas sp. PA-H2 TaxID=1881062 RepID=UPI000BF850C4|nr:GAF domain-containing protein [Collimonas sp. PA-H2]PFH10001.1 GAF domain-containing protein [Collimonas sp. PA-H2]
MFTSTTAEIDVDYALLARQAASILDQERDQNSNAAQFSALVYQTVADLNWVGFYWVRPRGAASSHGDEQELLVGPFQGKVACARIQFGRGVCGAAAVSREAVLVPDVHAFPGHIACDAASNAEIVIPVIKDGKLYGVFDIDSPSLNRFRPQDLQGLQALLAVFVAATDFE